MSTDFLFRLPLYTLAFFLGGIEYFLRTFMADAHRFEFLPTAIVSASLGFLVPLIVHDLPTPLLRILTAAQRRALSTISSLALLLFFLGLVLWFALTGIAMRPEFSASLPHVGILGSSSTLTWSCAFYLAGIIFTEMKARVLQ